MKLGLAGKGKGQAFFSFHVSNDDVIISYWSTFVGNRTQHREVVFPARYSRP
jgi:hypothetical protein